jgi:cyanophycinase
MSYPKGKLIPIGGNEDKGTVPEPEFPPRHYLNFFEFGILRRVLHEMKGPESRVEVITTASMIPHDIGKVYLRAFDLLGCQRVGLMHIGQRTETDDPAYLERIRQADGVLFTGGDQTRLANVFSGTAFHRILQERYYHEDFVIAGTSAGAMAMSQTMIYGGSSANAFLKGEVKFSEGLGFIENVIIDSHFVTRGRFGRLAKAVAREPHRIGLGLGEDTGVLIWQGNQLETIGSGLVVIMDGSQLGHTNISELEVGLPVSIEHLIMHVLAKGNCYLLNEKKFVVSSLTEETSKWEKDA